MGRRTQLNQERDAKTGKPVVTSAGKFMGMNTIFRSAGDPYMTRVWFWRLRLHIFHRPDLDPDPHDHPWDFWTFPIWPAHGYVEEVVKAPTTGAIYSAMETGIPPEFTRDLQVVPAFRPSFRHADHCHRVMGAYTGTMVETDDYLGDGDWRTEPGVDPNRKLVTLVWFSEPKRAWGFLKNRDGKWCWVGWRDYILGGGKDAPCK